MCRFLRRRVRTPEPRLHPHRERALPFTGNVLGGGSGVTRVFQ